MKNLTQFVQLRIDNLEDEEIPKWQKFLYIQVEEDGQKTGVFYPLFGHKEVQYASADNAPVIRVAYHPYVDINWYIRFYEEEECPRLASDFTKIRDKLLKPARETKKSL